MHIEQQDGENKVTMDFVLGRYSARESLRAQRRLEATAAAGGGDGGKRYHVHVYTNGSACELTGLAFPTGPGCDVCFDFLPRVASLFRTVRQPIHFINCHQFPAAASSSSPSPSSTSSAESALETPPLEEIKRGAGEGENQGEVEEEGDAEGEGNKGEGVEGAGGGVVEGEEDGVLSFVYEGEEDEELIEVDPEVEEIEESLSAL
ncbi:unnamed protein product [Closterium sp. NIES-54]